MGLPGGTEWIIIALVVLLLFGGKKIPELAKGLGGGIKNFKKAMKDDDKEEEAPVAKSEKIEDNVKVVKEEETTKPTENKTV